MTTSRDIVYDIVFIHGLADISKSWRRLRDLLTPRGFVIHFFDYETFNNRLDIPRIARLLKEYILLAVGDRPYQIVAHSQGGLVAEWYDAFERNASPLRRITTIATPFQGNMLPLLPGKDLIDHLFFSKKQIEGLSTFSPILRQLVRRRCAPDASQTEFIAFIGNVGRVMKIESDLVVAVCEANRNAIYYQVEGTSLKRLQTPEYPFIILEKSHFPLSYLKNMEPDTNLFAGLLLDLLEERVVEISAAQRLTQAALLIPKGKEKEIKWNSSMETILSRATLDEQFQLFFMDIKDQSENNLTFNDQPIEVRPGYFTYIL